MAAQYSQGGSTLAASNWDGSGFGNHAELVARDSNTSIGEGLDQTNSGANDIWYFYVDRTFSGDIGTTSTNAQIEFDATFTAPDDIQLRHDGTGRFYFDAATTCASASVSNGEFYHNDGTITTLHVNGGRVTIGAGATVANLVISNGLVTAEAGTDFTTVKMTGGVLNSDRGVTGTSKLYGGRATIKDTGGSNSNTFELGGGVLQPVRGNIGTIEGYAGSLDESAVDEELTITTLNRYARLNHTKNDTLVTRTNSNNPSGSGIISGPGFNE